jgi:hypothetical protein
MMNVLVGIFFWLGIITLVDGSLGLLYQDKWQKMVKNWDVRKIAWVEISIAWCLLAVHFVFRSLIG